jgi:hypothetical protein
LRILELIYTTWKLSTVEMYETYERFEKNSKYIRVTVYEASNPSTIQNATPQMQILHQSVHVTFLSFFVIEVNGIIKILLSFFSLFFFLLLFHRAVLSCDNILASNFLILVLFSVSLLPFLK